MRIMFALILSLTITPNGWADKAGVYAGAGVTWLTFDSENEVLDDAFDSDNDIGFRIEVGYIWDIGKPGGFMLGASGAYDSLGTLEGVDEDLPSLAWRITGHSFTGYFVGQQAITNWLDFVFKVGPSLIYTDIDLDIGSWRGNGHGAFGGLSGVLGFTFYPVEKVGLELAVQSLTFEDGSDLFIYQSVASSAQYRF